MILTQTDFNARNNTYGKVIIEVMTKDGIVSKHYEKRIDSFLENYWRRLYATHFNFSQTLIRFDGATSNFNYDSDFRSDDNRPEDYKGVVVGSGSAAVALDDVALDSLIQDGSTTGKLTYNALNKTRGSAGSFNISRSFVNDSGASIDVNEVGLAADNASSGANPFLIVRDVLGTIVSVADTEVINVSYVFTLTGVNRNWLSYITGFFDFMIELEEFVGDTNSDALDEGGVIAPKDSSNEKTYKGISLYSATNVEGLTWASTSGSHVNSTVGSFVRSPITVNVPAGEVSYNLEASILNTTTNDLDVRSVVLTGGSGTSYSSSSVANNPKAGRVLPSAKTLAAGEAMFVRWEFNYSL